MGSVLAYGMSLFETGYADEAATCLRFMLDLDPGDAFEVSAAMAQVGLVLPSGATGTRNG